MEIKTGYGLSREPLGTPLVASFVKPINVTFVILHL